MTDERAAAVKRLVGAIMERAAAVETELQAKTYSDSTDEARAVFVKFRNEPYAPLALAGLRYELDFLNARKLQLEAELKGA